MKKNKNKNPILRILLKQNKIQNQQWIQPSGPRFVARRFPARSGTTNLGDSRDLEIEISRVVARRRRTKITWKNPLASALSRGPLPSPVDIILLVLMRL